MLTVLLATRNRSRLLTSVLESFCQLQSPSSGWKLVVVDNGSTDQTGQVIASFANRLPLQSLKEPKLGKNFALNTGLALVEGDLIVFTDDDVFPHQGWLIQLRKAADAQPEFSIFGGSVVPRWEAPPPPWVQWVDRGPVYTLTDPLLKEGPVPQYAIYGPNMAVRSVIFQSGTRFDPCIGPRGSSYPMGSESELMERLEQQGHKAWFVPGAVVEHFIREIQLKKAWVMQRAIRYGRGQYRLRHAEEVIFRRLLLGTPRYLFRQIYKEGVAMAKAWLLFKREDLFRSRWRFNYLHGKIIEARILVRERTRRAQSTPSNVSGCCGILTVL